jgi:transcriptional regulator with XRE-family HTH domain
MVIEIVLVHLDFLIIEQVRKLRLKSGLSQMKLAHKVGVSEGFIGNIENQKNPAKHNIRLLAKIFIACESKSYSEFNNIPITSHDIVRMRMKYFDKEELDKQPKINTEPEERFEIISIIPLTEIEIKNFNKNDHYLTVIDK